MPVEYRWGNILDAREPFVLHQCNITSVSPRGLARDVFARFPHSNTYRRGNGYCRVVGTASFHAKEGCPTIINAYAEKVPGRCRSVSERDARLARLETILRELPPSVQAVAVPHRLGCGLAGGDWGAHLAMLIRVAEARGGMRIVVYKHK
jgi:hypothetical protein